MSKHPSEVSEPSYLERLPQWAQQQGSTVRGEIEVLGAKDNSWSMNYVHSPDPKECGFLYEDEYIAVVRDRVRFGTGQEGTYLRIFEQPTLKGSQGGVVVLPSYEGKFWLVRLYRHATREWELELPRGFCEPTLSPEENARRETKEELGVEPVLVSLLGQIAPNTGLLASFVSAWRAELPSAPFSTEQSRKEGIAAHVPMTAHGMRQAIRSGEIHDGFTLSTIAMADALGILDPR
jgi:ADP-ribose pyrophosphatase